MCGIVLGPQYSRRLCISVVHDIVHMAFVVSATLHVYDQER